MARKLVDAGPFCTTKHIDSKTLGELVGAAQECRLSNTVNARRPPVQGLRLYRELTQRSFWDKVTRNVMREQAARWGACRWPIYERKKAQLRQAHAEQLNTRGSVTQKAMLARHSRERKRLPNAVSELATVCCGADRAWTVPARKFATRELSIGVTLVQLISRFSIGALCLELSGERSR